MHRPRPVMTGASDAKTDPDASSRRRFLQLIAAAAAAPWGRALLPGLGLAAAGQAAAQTAEEEVPSATVRALLEVVKAQWGERLSGEDLRVIEENLGWMQRSSKTLRGAALRNADEPDVIFRAEPPEVS